METEKAEQLVTGSVTGDPVRGDGRTAESGKAGPEGENRAVPQPADRQPENGQEEELARLKAETEALRGRLEAAEEENRRLTASCMQAETERDGALQREAARERELVLRRYLEEKGLSGDAADIAVRGLRAEDIRLEDGGLTAESREALDGLMKGPFRPLFRIGSGDGKDGVCGIALDNPPMNAGIGAMSREEILSIRDGTERRRAIADNPGAFGL